MDTTRTSEKRPHDQGDRDTDDVVVVDRMTRRYGHGADAFVAVDGITMTVRRGELYAVLGTNGAGKTSALEVMEGLAPASAGAVRVFGHDPYVARRAVRPLVGIMLQEGGFPDDLTVAETVRTWAGTLSTPRPVHEALELVDLGHRAGVLVKQLSGGERRRLDLAVAILGRPQLLFLDEPTAGLDPESRNRTWALVRALLETGTTVVLTTHYLAEAEQLADRLAIMHRGRIVRTGTPAEVVAAAPAQISFGLPAEPGEPLPDFPAVLSTAEATATGSDGRPERVLTLETAEVQLTLTAVLHWAAARRVMLRRLEARAASLEHVFLDVVAGQGDNPHRAGHAPHHHPDQARQGDEQGAAA